MASTLDESRKDYFAPPPADSNAGQPAVQVAKQTHRKSIISPGSLIPVLSAPLSPAPVVQSRFLHGGPPLSEVPLSVPTATAVNQTHYRAFTDEEEQRLQTAWTSLDPYARMDVGGAKKARDPSSEYIEVSDPDNEEQAHLVPVGLDSLFSVDLHAALLAPAFWSSPPVGVVLSQWFYAPPAHSSRPSHLIKVYPVDPSLSQALEDAYTAIRPWEDSYAAELASALKVGVEAEAKLKHPLRVGQSVVDVIFRDATSGRVYSSGLMSSVSKSFLTSSKSGHGGGQVVLRGWEALREWKKKKVEVKKTFPSSVSTSSLASESSAIESDNDDSPSPFDTPIASRSRHASMNSASKPTPPQPPSASSGFFAAIKSKLGVVETAQSNGAVDDEQARNLTEEAMNGPRNREGQTAGQNKGKGKEGEGNEVGPVDELVLVVHGIGQKLAGTYSSFDFVHAVNQLRTNCTTLSTTSSLAPLLHSKRAQFIPVRWRTDLSFDDVDDSRDVEEEQLNNRFTLSDIEVKGSVPFVRQVVSGLVLDVPFYLSHHKQKMLEAVVRDANRVYRLFCARNPSFVANGGRVSIIAHSLGSALTADILSSQPTFVKPLKDMTLEEKRSTTQFVFDTRVLILVGSPLAFFLHLGRGQLIARRGRERTKYVARDIALDRAGRYGCLAADSVYNVFHTTDPVAFECNPTVDAEYAKLIKPIPIPSTNTTLIQNLTETYNRVSAMLDISSYWSSASTTSATPTTTVSTLDEADAKAKEEEEPVAAMKQYPARPKAGMKRMPSERPGLKKDEGIRITRAEKRFKALNPQGSVDFSLPAEGLNQYVESLSSHGSYWTDMRFATFCLTQLFASQEDLDRTGRDQLGLEEEDEEGDADNS